MKKADVTGFKDGLKIKFSGGVKRKNVVEMVERRQSGQCECMSQESKEKIKKMHVSESLNEVELTITGDLDIEEIQEAVSKSPLVN